jgi:hypothetical protein
MKVVIFKSPQRSIERLLKELQGLDVHVIDSLETFGKDKFWMRWEEAREVCIKSEHDDYLIIPDDILSIDLKAIKDIHRSFKNRFYVCSVSNDGRERCWNSERNYHNDVLMLPYVLKDMGFFDCGGLTNRKTLSRFKVKEPSRIFTNATSSGVGYQLTGHLRRIGARMFVPTPALCYHGDHESVMHPEERKVNPLISIPRMKVIVGIATMKGREESLKRTLESLRGQADQIRIYDNAKRDVDLTDNGKFYFLQEYKEPVYYFSCDDDLIYPPNYVKDMIEAIERTGTIVTHHGRILKGKGLKYYQGHRVFQCLRENTKEMLIHVAGTGVTAFRTDYFNPVDLYKSEDKRMSDCIFSLEAAKQGKRITVLQHSGNYFDHTDNKETIHSTESRNDWRQSEIADEILHTLLTSSN